MNSHIDMIKMILHSLTRLTELDASIHTKQDVVTLDVTMDDLVFVEKFQSLQTLKKNKEENVLFNDALNTFYLRLYGIRHMVKDHSDSERGNPLPPIGYSF